MKKNWLLLVLVFALLAGLSAGALSLRVLRSASAAEASPQAEATARVVVATRNLQPGEILAPTDLRLAAWPRELLPQGHLGDPAPLVGRVATAPVAAGQPVLEGAVAGAGVGLPAVIPEGIRAVSVRIDDVTGVAGFVSPGAMVDVLVTMERSQGEGDFATKVVLQAAPVIAMGKETQPSADGSPVETTVATLLVSPAGAERLVLAANQGKVQLALRGSHDRTEVQTAGARPGSLVGTDPASSPPAAGTRSPRPASQRAAPAAPAAERAVEVLSGSKRTVVSF